MNTGQKRRLLIDIQRTERDLSELRRCRTEIATNGYASDTISFGEGSESYTCINLQRITETLGQLGRELQRLKMLHDGGEFCQRRRASLPSLLTSSMTELPT